MVNRYMPQTTLGIATAWLLAASTFGGPTLFVDADAIGNNDGASWTDAFTSLQNALAAAAGSGETITEIWVAAGTYTPDAGTGDRTTTFQLQNGVAIYGGFAGGESLLTQRDPATNATILSGDLNGDDGPDFANNAENSHHVVTGSYTNGTALLDGFTITGGNANAGGIHKYGAGILAMSGNPTISNCTIAENVVNENNGFGGGMYVITSGDPLSLVNCVFCGNSAKYPYNLNSKGGGLYTNQGVFNDCQFIQNQSDEGSGAYISGEASFTNCDFIENNASRGAGVFRTSDKQVLFTDCTFARNTAYIGGGIDFYNLNGTVAITNCLFLANQASYGGGINGLANVMTLTNSIFIANSAGNAGGGIATSSSSPSVTNCTFVGNTTSGKGGGLGATASDSLPIITNCIFWQNSDPAGTGETGQIDRYSASAPLPIVNFCLIQGLTGTLGGNGNFDSDPLFVDADGADDVLGTEDDDVRFLAGSPAIDAGDDAAVPPFVTTDFDGQPRIHCAAVDLGAFESSSGTGGALITCPADVEIECGESIDPSDSVVGLATAEDACSGESVPVTFSDSVAAGTCAGESTITRTWVMDDGSGDPVSCVQVITIVDTTAPVLTVPAEITLDCDLGEDPNVAGIAVGSDACDPAPTVTFTDEITAGQCPVARVITRTWTATDACENTVSGVQVITLIDQSPPSIECPPDVSEELGAGDCAASGLNLGSPVAGDTCTDVVVENDAPDVFLPGTTIVTWTVTDACGHAATCEQTVTVFGTREPFLTCSADQTMLWPPNHEMAEIGLSVTVDDDCDSGLAPTIMVFANEDDEEDTGDGLHSPDALDIGAGTLRLRAERKGDSNGRVYLIVVEAEDTSGNVGTATCAVVVPHDRKRASLQAVMDQATAAQQFFQDYGAVPGGFVLVGDGPLIGPKQ